MSGDKASMEGTRWVGGEGNESNRPRLEFLAGGRVSGYTGCNMLSGTWRMEGDTIRFGALATTKRMCLGPEGEIEKRLLAAFSSESIGRRAGTRLTITAPRGASFEFQAQ